LQKAAADTAAFLRFGIQPRIVVKLQHMETRNTPDRDIDQKLCKWPLFLLSALHLALHITGASRTSASAGAIALMGAGVTGGRQ
jgi:hypothetical protein